MELKTYRSLNAWKKSIELAIYKLTHQFPESEKYGLKSQIQRPSVSIAANIAEGYGRTHRGDYLHHLSFSRGSLFEVETMLTIAARLKLVSRSDAIPSWNLAQDVGKLLNRLISSLSPEP